ncbi:hypothetical protein [Clostridium botulinum]|uniref:hypothetical protein n=1 Tax=Clostridium botulinum TaxID=1491 RepID=UPI000ABA9ADB|nr:hypothetical protein [Clostridium botulinum]MCC5426883.1 hypothetical protein [Clostridium botulinum]
MERNCKTDWRITIKGVGYTFYKRTITECIKELKRNDYHEQDITTIEQVNI